MAVTRGDVALLGALLTPIVPQVARDPWALDPGPRPFGHRIQISPAVGELGSKRLFTLRAAYQPSRWFAYEAELGHTPGSTAHALLHSLNLALRYPLPGRVQPYATCGYGMAVVKPGRSDNATDVTANLVAAGGGVEFYLREDLAVRVEARNVTFLGGERDRAGTVAYDYAAWTAGLSFSRRMGE